jgi:DNA-binding transcriptional LysR family regulator
LLRTRQRINRETSLDYDIADIRAFLQVVASGGISAAATRLSVSKSILSTRISRLERSLGTQLLHRSSRGVAVTDAGQRFYASMCDVVSRLQQAVDEVAGNESATVSGSVRITAPMTFGTAYLGPLFFKFMQEHPQLELTLDCDDRYVDVLSGGYDLAVRIGRLADSSLVARRLAPSARVLCCSPEYLERHGAPQSVAAIHQHQCICYGSASVAPYWQFAPPDRSGAFQQIVVRGRTHLNNGESMRDAAVAGLGLAVLPLFIAAPALRAGKLVKLLPQTPPSPDTIYAVYPQTRYVSRAVRALIDMLTANFRGVPPWAELAPSTSRAT